MIAEHKNWLKRKNRIYTKMYDRLRDRCTGRVIHELFPPLSTLCLEKAQEIVDILFQTHPEVYNGTSFPEGDVWKEFGINHGKDMVEVEYLDWGCSTHSFLCHADGTVTYTQISHGDETFGIQYGDLDPVMMSADEITRHVRRKFLPRSRVQKLAA